jgi:hypothetical protein
MNPTDILDFLSICACQRITTGRMSNMRSVKVLNTAGEEGGVSTPYNQVPDSSPTLLIRHEAVKPKRYTLAGQLSQHILAHVGSTSKYAEEEGGDA